MGQGQKQPRKHHYIPQMILRNFCDEGGTLFARRRGDANTFTPSLKDVFAMRDLNTVELADGSLNTDLEAWYANALEGEGATFMAALLEAVRAGKSLTLTAPAWSFWHHFMYHHIKRQPHALERVVERTKMAERVQQLVEEQLRQDAVYLDQTERERLETRVLQTAKVKARSLPPSDDVQSVFREVGMAVFVVADSRKSLVIGDCAIAAARIGGCEATFAPVAWDVALGYYEEPCKVAVFRLDRDTVRRMNEATAAASTMIGGRSAQLLESLYPTGT